MPDEVKKEFNLYEVEISRKAVHTLTIFVEVGPDEGESEAHDAAVDFEPEADFDGERITVEPVDDVWRVQNIKKIDKATDFIEEPDVVTPDAMALHEDTDDVE